MKWGVASTLALALTLLLPHDAKAQTQTQTQTAFQLWANLTFDWVKSDRLTYEVDFEPKAMVDPPAGQPAWKNLDVTPNVTFNAAQWLDLTGDLATGYTHQTDDLNTFELTPRVGAEVHLLSRLLSKREHHPKRRFAFSNYFRIEWRNFFYNNDEPVSSSWRFRNRLGCLFALNRAKYTDDGAYYALTDFEWFLPLSDPAERFSNRQRFRVGVGYRRSFNWRFEALYLWTRSRAALEDNFTRSEAMIDLRVKRAF